MVAAATSFSGRKPKAKDDGKVRGGEEWMRVAWDMFDIIAEYRQAPTIQGALLSRAKLFIEEQGADGTWLPTTNKIALAVLNELYGGPDGQSEMLRLCGVNFTVTGGCWIVSPPFGTYDEAGTDEWQTVAETEITCDTAGNWKINGKAAGVDGDRLRFRMHRPHPKNARRSDSATRPTLPVLYQIVQLRKRTSAQIDSRLSGPGVWILPSETEFPAAPARQLNIGEPPTTRDAIAPGDAQGAADLLLDAASLAIEDQASVESRIPLIFTMPGEQIKNVKKPIDFSSELDKAGPALRKELLDSLAQGMDIPPDVLLSGRNSNHWNAWLSDESNTKIHAEPTLKIITTALTGKFLRPALDGLVPDATKFRIASDTSEMRLRPNRSAEATELNDRLILSDEAVLRENGFTPEDAMTKEQAAVAIIRKAALGSTTPELVAWAWKQIGIDVPAVLADQRPPVEGRPAPSLDGHPQRSLPQQPKTQTPKPKGEGPSGDIESPGGTEKATQASLVPSEVSMWRARVAEQIVDRALQRMGNRIKQKYGLRGPQYDDLKANRAYLAVQVSPTDLDDLLEDAWDGCVLGDYGIPGSEMARALDVYTRALVIERYTPSVETIGRALEILVRHPAPEMGHPGGESGHA